MFPETALYRGADVRELDRRAMAAEGVDAWALMQRAASALYDNLRRFHPSARRVLVLCGGGNNGGDGYALASIAREAGLEVTVCALRDRDRLSGAARQAAETWGGPASRFSDDLLTNADVVIDALLGTGLDRPMTDEYAQVITALNGSGLPVIAADIPSGLDADTGAVMGVAVRASLTVTFIGLKAGLFTGRGPALAGKVIFAPLAVPAGIHEGIAPVGRLLQPSDLAAWLPPRERDAHKGDFGHAWLLGGGEGMPGALRLAGEAALRAGAGRVSALCWPGNVTAVAAGRPEMMCRGLVDAEALPEYLAHADVLAVGPGLGQDEWAGRTWQRLGESRHELPLVIDADGLNWLAKAPFRLSPADVLTPHPGEAARLLGVTVAEVERDRLESARALAGRFNAVAVLKGAGSIIAAPDGRLAVCDRGNPGMAGGGMGDALTGVIAAFRAQGLAAFEAACAGVLAHALAGDRAARQGERGLLAGDLINELRAVVNPGKGT